MRFDVLCDLEQKKILLDAIEMNKPARITSYVLKFYS